MIWAAPGCGGGGDNNADGDGVDGDYSDERPGGPCFGGITIEDLPDQTNEKELLVVFSVTDCDAPIDAWIANGERYYPATELSSGKYRRYVPMEEGENSIRVSVKDGNGFETISESVSVTYAETGIQSMANAATVHGSVFAEGSEVPLSGVKVFVRNVSGVATSDASGQFSLPVPAGRTLITLEHEGYTLAQRWVTAESGRHHSLTPAYLVQTDSKTATFSPESGGALENSVGDIAIEATGNAVKREVEVSAISFPEYRSLPGQLPDSSGWTQAFEASPEGVRFEQPVVIRQENVNGFPPGYSVPVGYYNRDKGAWEPSTMAVVSEDGQWLEFTTNHFSPYDLNAPVDPRDQASNGNNDKDDCEKGTRGSSIVDDISGQLSLYHPASSYREDNEQSTLHLMYNSGRAAGEIDVAVPIDANSTDGIERISATVDLAGNRQELSTVASEGGEFLIAARFKNKTPDGTTVADGIVPAAVEITKFERSTYMSASVFGGGGLEDSGVPTREALPFSVRKAVPAIVDSPADNPFGTGWEISVQESLQFNDQLGLGLWRRGDRRPRVFMTGLPTTEGLDLPDDIGQKLVSIEFDSQGHLYLLNEDGEIYIADSLQNAGQVELLETDGLDVYDLIPYGEDILAVDSDAALHRISYPNTIELLSTIGETYMMQQVMSQLDGELTNIDVLYPEAGMIADKNGYIWMMGVGIVYGEDGSFSTRPLMIRVDISTAEPTFLASPLMQLTEFQIPATMAYDEAEHAIYYLFYSEDLLRRFDIAGLNESVVMKEEAFVDDSRVLMRRGPKGDSYILSGEKVIRISPQGILSVLANTRFEQVTQFGNQIIEGVGFDTQGEVLYAAYSNDDYRFSLVPGDYSVGIFSDLPLRIESDGSGYRMSGAGETRYFNAQGQLTNLTDSKGRQATYSYADGRLSSYTSRFGKETTFSYTNGYLSGITDPAGRTRMVTVDADGQLTRISDADGNETLFEYDESGHMTGRSGGAGEIDYQWDTIGSISQISLDTGETRSFTSLLQAAQPDGICADCWATYIDGEGHKHETHYALNGQPDRYRLNGDELQINRAYNPLNGQITATVRKGEQEISQATRDPLGRLVHLELYGVEVSNSTYDEEWNEEEHHFRSEYCSVYEEDDYTEYYCNGESTYFYYDDDGQLTDLEDSSGETYSMTSDAFGNITNITDPLGYDIVMQRDAAGNLTQLTDTAGRQFQYGYSHNNVMTSYTEPGGSVFSAALARSATCDGCETSGRDLLETITDPFGNDWSSQILADGNLGGVTTPLGHSDQYNYNGNRLLSNVTDAAGKQVGYSYDQNNLLTGMTLDGATTTYQYNDRHHLVLAESPEYRIEWTRDYSGEENHTVSETVTHKASGQVTSFNSPYNAETGQIQSLDTGFNTHWDFSHGGYGDTDQTISGDGVEVRAVVEYGQLSSIDISNSNGDWVLSEYLTLDAARRVDYLSWSSYANSGYLTYTYKNGNREPKRIESDAQALDTLAFQYDANGRITSQAGPETVTFAYDDGGRIQQSSYAGAFVYDDDWRVTSTDLADYSYSDSGARKERIDQNSNERWVYEFNAIGQLLQVQKYTDQSAASPYSTVVLSYDPLQRLSRVDVDGSSRSYQWIDYVLLAEFDDNGDVIRSYMPSLGLDGVAVIRQGNTNYYALIDPNGSVRALFNNSGNRVARYRYDPYGRLLASSGAIADQPRRFAGALWLEEIGLYYMRSRYYDPEIGQFISRDPVWQLKLEPYMYCDGKPYQCSDPLGLKGGAGNAASFAGGQIKGGMQTAMGPAGTAWQMYDGLSGYKRGDARHNGSHGMRKIASVTFLDKSPAFRKVMKNVEGFWDMVSGKDKDKDNDKKDKDDPCD